MTKDGQIYSIEINVNSGTEVPNSFKARPEMRPENFWDRVEGYVTKDSPNKGRPFVAWKTRDARGRFIDGSFHFTDGK